MRTRMRSGGPLWLMCFALLSVLSGRSSAQTQQADVWHILNRQLAEDITGRRDTAVESARKLSDNSLFTVAVLRTVYQHPRFTAQGKPWQTKYFSAMMDCSAATLSPMRLDYYNGDAFLDASDMRGVTFKRDVFEADADWKELFNFACSMPGSGAPPSR